MGIFSSSKKEPPEKKRRETVEIPAPKVWGMDDGREHHYGTGKKPGKKSHGQLRRTSIPDLEKPTVAVRRSSFVAPFKRERVDTNTIRMDYERAFHLIDKDHSGTLSKKNLRDACKKDPAVRQILGLPEEIRKEDGSQAAFDKIFREMDKDKTKEISMDEFIAYWTVEVRAPCLNPWSLPTCSPPS